MRYNFFTQIERLTIKQVSLLRGIALSDHSWTFLLTFSELGIL